MVACVGKAAEATEQPQHQAQAGLPGWGAPSWVTMPTGAVTSDETEPMPGMVQNSAMSTPLATSRGQAWLSTGNNNCSQISASAIQLVRRVRARFNMGRDCVGLVAGYV